MPNIRMFPPVGASSPIARHGRSYSPSAAVYQDVPDFDAKTLEANGWTRVGQAGATAARPSPAVKGQQYLDTTLGYLVVYDGAAWRNPATGAAV